MALSFASVFASDISALSGYYERVFDLPEVAELTSPHFRGLWVGPTVLGFSAFSAYELLQLPQPKVRGPGVTSFLTFECASEPDVTRSVEAAVAEGGSLVQAPHRTYYGAWQAVLLDPEGNAFRINHLRIGGAEPDPDEGSSAESAVPV